MYRPRRGTGLIANRDKESIERRSPSAWGLGPIEWSAHAVRARDLGKGLVRGSGMAPNGRFGTSLGTKVPFARTLSDNYGPFVARCRLRDMASEQRPVPETDRLAQAEALVKERTEVLWLALSEMEATTQALREVDARWVQRFLRAARFKDDETPAHIERMSRYCELLAGIRVSDQQWAASVRFASQLHDIGKVAIPDAILLKMGPLTEDEKAAMRTHAEIGRDILRDERSGVARLASTIAFTHHERWDGRGYPSGLTGEAIPLEGRIAAIADAFDALTTNRIYRKAFTLPEAVEKMKRESGRQFDPSLLESFLGAMPAVMDIHERHPDEKS